MTVDPLIAAALEVLDLALDDMRRCIKGASVETLNWRPAGDETNSIAVLAVHSMTSTRSWLSVALGVPLPARDRPAEFAVSADAARDLLAAVESLAADCTKLLDGAGAIDWSAERRTHARPAPGASEHVSAAWALVHAMEHLREHVGQMLLTRQLWDGSLAREL